MNNKNKDKNNSNNKDNNKIDYNDYNDINRYSNSNFNSRNNILQHKQSIRIFLIEYNKLFKDDIELKEATKN